MTPTIQVQSPNNEIESSCGTPLVVDLDGTLLRTDLTLETALRLIKQKPWRAAWIPFWLLRGRAYLKRRIFRLVQIDASLLPLHEDLLPWLQLEKSRGRRLVLATDPTTTKRGHWCSRSRFSIPCSEATVNEI